MKGQNPAQWGTKTVEPKQTYCSNIHKLARDFISLVGGRTQQQREREPDEKERGDIVISRNKEHPQYCNGIKSRSRFQTSWGEGQAEHENQKCMCMYGGVRENAGKRHHSNGAEVHHLMSSE